MGKASFYWSVREARSSCACKFVCRRCNRWECVTGPRNAVTRVVRRASQLTGARNTFTSFGRSFSPTVPAGPVRRPTTASFHFIGSVSQTTFFFAVAPFARHRYKNRLSPCHREGSLSFLYLSTSLCLAWRLLSRDGIHTTNFTRPWNISTADPVGPLMRQRSENQSPRFDGRCHRWHMALRAALSIANFQLGYPSAFDYAGCLFPFFMPGTSSVMHTSVLLCFLIVCVCLSCCCTEMGTRWLVTSFF